MKKLYLLAIAVIGITVISNAQLRFGVKGGTSSSQQVISSTEQYSLFSNGEFDSFHAGLISECRIGGNFYLQPQLLYTRKGATHFTSTADGAIKVRISYVGLPVTVIYKLPLPFGNAFAGAGAAFSYGLGGKQVQDGHKEKLYSDIKDWKHEDLSLSFTAGVQFRNGLFISTSSEKGLLNVYKVDGVNVKNKSMSVSVGYFFNRDKQKGKG